MKTNETRLKAILDRNSTEATLIANVQNLDLLSESGEFWLNIVRDKTYSSMHRRIAIVQYFVRHSYYAKANELGLQSLNLLPSEYLIQVLRMETGAVPAQQDNRDGRVRIYFTFDEVGKACVYLSMFPDADDAELIQSLFGAKTESSQIITDVSVGEHLVSGADITWNRWQRGQVYKYH
ncbi:MAG TPA: hypothetical protein VFC07_15925 [Verrucomicrobiae bacterium]|nr:hypothetical protein [Verrucomicrobiae bacterium]